MNEDSNTQAPDSHDQGGENVSIRSNRGNAQFTKSLEAFYRKLKPWESVLLFNNIGVLFGDVRVVEERILRVCAVSYLLIAIDDDFDDFAAFERMVPNKESSKCSTCNSLIGNQGALGCGMCSTWLHASCIGS
uniref:Uncharacterized protein n=1 Tax=Glossina austeni TaxID=7395 RepID=A0A1A9V045_GLOAU